MAISAAGPLVIVGAGLAAYTLAREWRKLDAETPLTIVTADDGAAYSKPMLSNAFSKGQSAQDLIQQTPEEVAQRLNAKLITHTEVTHLDLPTQSLHLSQGAPIGWQRLVLATGATPFKAPLEGNAVDQVLSINSRLDFGRFEQALEGKKRVLIMGAGLIGCEFANDLAAAGYEVEVVAPSESLLRGLLPAQLGEALKAELEHLGVRFWLGPMVSRVDRDASGGLQVALTNGQQRQTDLVLSAIGLKPNIKLAREAGLAVQSGICVDRRLQSASDRVYALGDCAEVNGLNLMYVMPLMNAARALAKTLAGQPTDLHWPAMPVTVKTPACPLVVYPPRREGDWQIEGSGANLAAVCRSGGDVVGFALSGDRIKERNNWLKAVPPLFSQ